MTSVSSTPVRPTTQRLSLGRLGLTALIAMVGAAIVNVLVHFVAGAVGIDWSFVVPQMGAPIPPVAAGVASLVGVGAGMLVLAVLNALTREPVRWFTWVGLVALLVSLASPLSITGAPVGLVVTLELMHVVAGLFAVVTPRVLRR
jgi:hypothetical protein